MTKLLNPEWQWDYIRKVNVISRLEVEKCIGPTTEILQLLTGGQTNTNIRIGDDRVLRLYRRDAFVAGKELALLQKKWKNFIVPDVIKFGDGFLLTKYMNCFQLDDNQDVGVALGKALAEIHSNIYKTSGFISDHLQMEEPMENFVNDMWSYLCSFMEITQKSSLSNVLLKEVIDFFDSKIEDLQKVVGASVLLHGDFGVSNLYWSDRGKPLIFDWELAYVGSALIDLGQLFRWEISQAFEDAFIGAYKDSGGCLVDNWKYWASILDLISLTGFLYKSAHDTRRVLDLTDKIKSILQVG